MLSRINKTTWVVILFLLIAVLIRVIYLFTAQSTINGEEAALGIESMSMIKDLPLDLDLSENRLYSISRYITAVAFYIFGINIETLKSVSIVLSLIYVLAIWKLSNLVFPGNRNYLRLFLITYIVLSPALLNIWSLKARGGFIDSLAIGTVIIYLTCKYFKEELTEIRLLKLGYLWGLAFWVHPITIGYILTSVFIVSIVIKFNVKKIFLLLISGFVGVLPLIIINMLNNYNTFKYLLSSESEGPAGTIFDKFSSILFQAFPMLIGVGQEWETDYIYPRPISYLLIFLFLLIICTSLVRRGIIIKKGKGIESIDILILFSFIHCMLMAITSWGSFLIEPRRALPLYTALPFLIIYPLGLFKRWSIAFFIPLILLSIYSNVDYIKKNLHGFDNSLYKDNTKTVDFLEENSIDHVYTDFWYGNKITFKSEGKITWSKTPFLPSSHGFISTNEVNKKSAFIFGSSYKEEIKEFEKHLIINQVAFKKVSIDDAIVYYDFSLNFDVYSLFNDIVRLNEKRTNSLNIFDILKYQNGTISGLYDKEGSFVWTKEEVSFPFRTELESNYKLSINTLNLRPTKYKTNAKVFIDDQLIGDFESDSEINEFIINSKELEGGNNHILKIKIDVWKPASETSVDDDRELGIPLRSILLDTVGDIS